MTLAQVIALINSEIIPNNNNEITANVLRPILIEMLQQPNDLIGDLSTLTTIDNSNLVNAINELQNDLSNVSGINIFQGVGDPNSNPPSGATIADFYSELDVSSSVVGLWIFDGLRWVRLSDKYISSDYPQALTPGEQQQARDNIDVYSRDEVDDAIENAIVSDAVLYTPQVLTPQEQEVARDNIDAVGNPEMEATIVPDWGDDLENQTNF